jgi:hypothetical protein
MKKFIITLVLFLSIVFIAIAQKTIDNYQYVIIPLKYDFLSEKDQYRLNTLTRHLFKEKGFIALFDAEEFPEEINKDRCEALYANVEKIKGGLFATKLEIVLKDCFGKEVYRTETGSSREKDFQKAYNEAVRNAFSSIENMNYKYQPVDAEVEEKNEKVIENNTDIDKVETKTKDIENSISDNESDESMDLTLYAQKKPYGYQLVDASPKIVMQLLNTSAKDIFLVRENKAIVFKEDNKWFYYENDNGKIIEKELKIKF